MRFHSAGVLALVIMTAGCSAPATQPEGPSPAIPTCEEATAVVRGNVTVEPGQWNASMPGGGAIARIKDFPWLWGPRLPVRVEVEGRWETLPAGAETLQLKVTGPDGEYYGGKRGQSPLDVSMEIGERPAEDALRVRFETSPEAPVPVAVALRNQTVAVTVTQTTICPYSGDA